MSRLVPPLGPGDHLRGGDLTAPARLVEFGDFQCPFCGAAYPILRALERMFGDRLCVAYRHLPITAAHPMALGAAEAAEAAGAQGRFWPMHDLLFEDQEALAPADLLARAERLDLDLARFVDDMRTHRHRSRVRGDLRSGAFSGVAATPTFFLNGERWDAPWDFEALAQGIAELLRPQPSP